MTAIKQKDASGNFVIPVTLTNESGSYLGGTLLPMNIVISGSDLQMGAVELKDGTTDNRATIHSDGWLQVSSSVDDKLIPSANTEYSYLHRSSDAFVSGSVVKQSGGILYNVSGYKSGSAGFVHIHNSTGSLLNSDIPTVVIAVGANSNFSQDYGRFGIPFGTGIVAALSSTPATLTSGSDECWFNVSYK